MYIVQKGVQSAAGCNAFDRFGFVCTVLNFHSTHRLGNPLSVCGIKVSEYLHFFLINFSHVYKCNARLHESFKNFVQER